jgi:membrane protein implicated in regulation of membrane protease activity
VLLSRVLSNPTNWRLSVLVGGLLTAVNIATLFVGTPTLAYALLTTAMIATGVAIAWYAWNWVEPLATQPSHVSGSEFAVAGPTIEALPRP